MRDLRYRRTRDSMSLGILLIGMGVVFMLMTIGVLPHHALRSWWPVFVVVAGLTVAPGCCRLCVTVVTPGWRNDDPRS